MSTDISPLTEAGSTRKAALPRPALLHLIPGANEPVQLPLALEWEVSPGVPAVPTAPPRLRVVGPDVAATESTEPLPEPGRWAAQLARAIDEVARGERPPGQLTRWVSRAELAKLSARATFATRHRAARRGRASTTLHTVRAVRVCPVAPGVVETSAVLVGSERAHAIAIRLEAVAGRWLATAIEMR